MKNLRGTYVHRGDASRRRRRVKQTVMALSFFGATAFVLGNRKPTTPSAEAAPVKASAFSINLNTDRSLTFALDSARGELELMRAQLDRAKQVIGYSSRYKIGADLASSIMEVAQAEGIDPELAFRLVKLESEFNPRATSPVGAIGLTQMMLPTARYYDREVTREKLYDPTTNLRIGFRYLRGLIGQYHGDAKLALLVYNRGEVAVNNALRAGLDPSNGYDRILTKGYKGKGVLE